MSAYIPTNATTADLARIILTRVMDQPCSVLVTAPTGALARDRLQALAAALPAWMIDKVSLTVGREQVRLKDGSTLRARSRRARGWARGYSLDLAVVDEHLTLADERELLPASATSRNGKLIRLQG